MTYFVCTRSTHKPYCSKQAAAMGDRGSVIESSVDAMGAMGLTKQSQLALESSHPPAVLVPACIFCGGSKQKLLICGKCKAVRYCGPDHQKRHWCASVNTQSFMVYCF